ncbi:MAG TPA: cytochrome c [Saprospiraceae bacterium]|nr:cytochrome c [Saprospiraceae bacterium]
MNNLKTIFSWMLGSLLLLAVSCQSGPPKNSRAAQSEKGKAFFMSHCASCHGPNANPDRIANLKTPPPDLTKIMERRKGLATFPVAEIASYIDGRKDVQLHSRDMPAWGKYFADEEKLTNDEIKGKMGELIAYLMSIQK